MSKITRESYRISEGAETWAVSFFIDGSQS
jgi:hypothetical protein